MTKDLVERLKEASVVVCHALDEVAALLDAAPSTVTSEDLLGQGSLTLVLDDLKREIKGGLTAVNKAETVVRQHFCQKLIEEERMPYREHEEATFSPAVSGHFSVVDADALYAWLCESYETPNDLYTNWLCVMGAEDGLPAALRTPQGALVELVSKKTAIRALCSAAYEAGDPLPPGTKGHVVATVNIRRKNRG